MIEVINLESSVTQLPCFEKKGKNKSQTVSQPKPRALLQKRKKSKSKTTSLVQAIVTPPSEKVPTKDFDKTYVADIQALLVYSEDELKNENAREEMDEDIQDLGNEEAQTNHSTKNPTKEPISTKHESPSPTKDDPESSKSKQPVDASDSTSSSCSETFRPYDNYMPITER
ncbi:hypothetical protein Tco_0680887 [Tanacetum coccineum]|uniref:Uncharacterized protein n=1 Tax=Tanacetum coccineum TaxID=301880 RepID=A0ABQ4XMZ0_9ASTR